MAVLWLHLFSERNLWCVKYLITIIQIQSLSSLMLIKLGVCDGTESVPVFTIFQSIMGRFYILYINKIVWWDRKKVFKLCVCLFVLLCYFCFLVNKTFTQCGLLNPCWWTFWPIESVCFSWSIFVNKMELDATVIQVKGLAKCSYKTRFYSLFCT